VSCIDVFTNDCTSSLAGCSIDESVAIAGETSDSNEYRSLHDFSGVVAYGTDFNVQITFDGCNATA
jgi:hypothetical protein